LLPTQASDQRRRSSWYPREAGISRSADASSPLVSFDMLDFSMSALSRMRDDADEIGVR